MTDIYLTISFLRASHYIYIWGDINSDFKWKLHDIR